MSHNTFGHLFRVTTFGESHGVAIGCVVDGCPPLLPLTAEEIRELSRETGRLLALAGAGGWGAKPGEPVPLVPRCSMVERLEMYRFLLQR